MVGESKSGPRVPPMAVEPTTSTLHNCSKTFIYVACGLWAVGCGLWVALSVLVPMVVSVIGAP